MNFLIDIHVNKMRPDLDKPLKQNLSSKHSDTYYNNFRTLV